MAGKRMPELPDTGRSYVDRTRGGWLQSPGLERHVFRRGRGRWLVLALLLLGGLAALSYWRS